VRSLLACRQLTSSFKAKPEGGDEGSLPSGPQAENTFFQQHVSAREHSAGKQSENKIEAFKASITKSTCLTMGVLFTFHSF
jgi:hypothetical protein